MAFPIVSPMIPCIHPLRSGFFPGRMLRIQGSTTAGVQRFAINLQCGPNTDPRDDIALHLNFRFVEMCVVRNNLSSLMWGPEETDGGMPLMRGENFEALLLCEPNSIKVALNGVHFCEFPHRIPYQRITHLAIDGDVCIHCMYYETTNPAMAPPSTGFMQPGYAPPEYGAPPPSYGAPSYGAPQGFP